jgi:hypothetical protein
MQKVFRLLRHNTEQGPYTIGELLGQHLVPGDLIWVDGESTAWAHPHEMEVLKYAIDVNLLKKKSSAPTPLEQAPEVKAPVKPANVWTESPALEIERKAEEIRQRTLAFKKASTDPAAVWHPQQATIIPLSENDIEFSYHKRKGLPVGEVLMGAMVVGLLTIGWYGGGKDLFQSPKAVASAVAVKMVATEENAAIGAPDVAVTDTTTGLAALVDSSALKDSIATIAIRKAPRKNTPTVSTTATSMSETPVVAINPEPAPVKKSEPEVAKTPIQQPVAKTEEKSEAANNVAKVEEQAPTEEVEKKKGLGKMLKGLFKKKKKDDEKVSEEVKPDTN